MGITVRDWYENLQLHFLVYLVSITNPHVTWKRIWLMSLKYSLMYDVLTTLSAVLVWVCNIYSMRLSTWMVVLRVSHCSSEDWELIHLLKNLVELSSSLIHFYLIYQSILSVFLLMFFFSAFLCFPIISLWQITCWPRSSLVEALNNDIINDFIDGL